MLIYAENMLEILMKNTISYLVISVGVCDVVNYWCQFMRSARRGRDPMHGSPILSVCIAIFRCIGHWHIGWRRSAAFVAARKFHLPHHSSRISPNNTNFPLRRP